MANTPNLGLHQWQPDDSFLREDFNTDFGKIDTAVGTLQTTMPRVFLRQYTTTAAAQTVSLSLTGIDWASYWQVIIYITGTGTTTIAGYLRFNKKSTVGNYHYGSIGSNSVDANLFGGFSVGRDSTRITLECASNVVSGTMQMIGENFGFMHGYVYPSAVASLDALTEMNLTPYDSQVSLPAGTKFTIYGVRK